LVTSGIDGVYPAGLAVATVSQIEITPDSPFARIICVPTGGVENHKQVLLVSIPRMAEPLEAEIISAIKPDAKTKKTESKNSAVKPVETKPEVTKPAAIKAEPEKPQLIPETKPPVITPTNNPSKPHAAE